MVEYRLYSFDLTYHIVSAKAVLALDELAALQVAEQSCEDHAIEVWQGARRVARVKPGNTPLSASDRASL